MKKWIKLLLLGHLQSITDNNVCYVECSQWTIPSTYYSTTEDTLLGCSGLYNYLVNLTLVLRVCWHSREHNAYEYCCFTNQAKTHNSLLSSDFHLDHKVAQWAGALVQAQLRAPNMMIFFENKIWKKWPKNIKNIGFRIEKNALQFSKAPSF